jgi:hypothetical protein
VPGSHNATTSRNSTRLAIQAHHPPKPHFQSPDKGWPRASKGGPVLPCLPPCFACFAFFGSSRHSARHSALNRLALAVLLNRNPGQSPENRSGYAGGQEWWWLALTRQSNPWRSTRVPWSNKLDYKHVVDSLISEVETASGQAIPNRRSLPEQA